MNLLSFGFIYVNNLIEISNDLDGLIIINRNNMNKIFKIFKKVLYYSSVPLAAASIGGYAYL